MKDIRLLDLFAGIGGFRFAAECAARDMNKDFECIGFSEIDRYAAQTYRSIYQIDGEVELGDIVSFTDDPEKIKSLPGFSVLTGGFPCQPFSMMGAQKGFEDERGGLIYNLLKIIDLKSPSVVLLENVKNIKNHDNGKTIGLIVSLLRDHGYGFVEYDIFNTADFGLPQVRNRVYILAIKNINKSFSFKADEVKSRFETWENKAVKTYSNVIEILEQNVGQEFYLSDRIKPTILANGSGNFVSKSEINQFIARPLTATMVKMHRACQDNYYSENFISSLGKIDDSSLSKDLLSKEKIRKITPTEAFALQGFPKKFATNASLAGVSNHQLFKQSGNAVSVNVPYAIIRYVLEKMGEPYA